jgi:hypothetical protein
LVHQYDDWWMNLLLHFCWSWVSWGIWQQRVFPSVDSTHNEKGRQLSCFWYIINMPSCQRKLYSTHKQKIKQITYNFTA